MQKTFTRGQLVYVKPTGGTCRFGRTRVRTDMNPATGKPFDPVVTIGPPVFMAPVTMVNTELGPVAIDRVMPFEDFIRGGK